MTRLAPRVSIDSDSATIHCCNMEFRKIGRVSREQGIRGREGEGEEGEAINSAPELGGKTITFPTLESDRALVAKTRKSDTFCPLLETRDQKVIGRRCCSD